MQPNPGIVDIFRKGRLADAESPGVFQGLNTQVPDGGVKWKLRGQFDYTKVSEATAFFNFSPKEGFGEGAAGLLDSEIALFALARARAACAASN